MLPFPSKKLHFSPCSGPGEEKTAPEFRYRATRKGRYFMNNWILGIEKLLSGIALQNAKPSLKKKGSYYAIPSRGVVKKLRRVFPRIRFHFGRQTRRKAGATSKEVGKPDPARAATNPGLITDFRLTESAPTGRAPKTNRRVQLRDASCTHDMH